MVSSGAFEHRCDSHAAEQAALVTVLWLLADIWRTHLQREEEHQNSRAALRSAAGDAAEVDFAPLRSNASHESNVELVRAHDSGGS